MVSSATAIAFRPGQFATSTPAAVAALTSIVFTPEPARMISWSSGVIMAAVTFVDRTINTPALVAASASTSAWSARPG